MRTLKAGDEDHRHEARVSAWTFGAPDNSGVKG